MNHNVLWSLSGSYYLYLQHSWHKFLELLVDKESYFQDYRLGEIFGLHCGIDLVLIMNLLTLWKKSTFKIDGKYFIVKYVWKPG